MHAVESSRTIASPLRLRALRAVFVLGAAHPALAQAPAGVEPGWRPSATITPWIQGTASIDGGGEFRASGAIFRAGVDGPIARGHRAGLSVEYGYTEYSFSSPATPGRDAAWTDVHHLGLSVPFLLRGPSEWTFLVSPSIDYLVEEGADWSDAPTYGAVVAATKRVGPRLALGLGVSAFDRLEEVGVIPFPVVDWRITDRLRLTNPLPAGPTGGAGLEVSYRIDLGWTIGVGGAYRSGRFRLREDGPSPNGIGEERAIPAFVHAGRLFGPNIALDLYAGALLGGVLRVEDSSGGRLAEQDFDPAPLLGATLSARF